MFYAHFVLSKKGPLARIWLAAHWDKKLTKAHVFETNIEGSVEAIIQPKVKLALRTSGHLLLGVVRIYSRKAKYLLADCNEAFVKIKMAFRPGVVDLPEENREAAMSAITLPESFHEFDTTMADLNDIDVHAQFAVNQSRPEEITMREDLGNITLIGDDGFGDMGFDGGMMDDATLDDDLYMKHTETSNLLLDNGSNEKDIDLDSHHRDDDVYAAAIDDDDDDYEGPPGADDDESNDDNFGTGIDAELFGDNFVGESGGLFEDPIQTEEPSGGGLFEDPIQPEPVEPEPEQPPEPMQHQPVETLIPPFASPSRMDTSMYTLDPAMPQLAEEPPIPKQLTTLQNDSEAFALKPIDISTMGTERKIKKKRKLVIDDQKAIASETMKLQLSDTSDIVTTLDLAPPTKKLMHWKETGGVEKLFAFPGRSIVSKRLSRGFMSNLVTKSAAEKVETPAVVETPETPIEHVRTEELEVRNKIGADGLPRLIFAVKRHLVPTTSDMPELPLATDDSYRPAASEAPSILDDSLQTSHLDQDQSSRLTVPDVENTTTDISATDDPNLTLVEHPPSPANSVHSLPPAYGYSDDDGDNDDGGGYEDDDLTEPEQEPDAEVRAEPELEPEPEAEPEAELEAEPEAEPEEEEEEEDVPLEAVEGEAVEEAEERRWNKRSQQMLHVLNRVFKQHETAGFKELVARSNRKQVASKFYTLLVLKKAQVVNVEQSEPYQEITMTMGPEYTTLL